MYTHLYNIVYYLTKSLYIQDKIGSGAPSALGLVQVQVQVSVLSICIHTYIILFIPHQGVYIFRIR